MSKIWFTSDLHFCHNRDFLYGPRGFTNVQDMNLAIVNNWNSLVDVDDDVYVLGDLVLNDTEEGLRLIKSLKGRIHVILGNHDTKNKIEEYKKCYNIVEIEWGLPLKYKGWRFFLSHYPSLTSNTDDGEELQAKVYNLYGHTHQQTNFLYGSKTNYHVGLDSHNNCPILIDDIIEDIKEENK